MLQPLSPVDIGAGAGHDRRAVLGVHNALAHRVNRRLGLQSLVEPIVGARARQRLDVLGRVVKCNLLAHVEAGFRRVKAHARQLVSASARHSLRFPDVVCGAALLAANLVLRRLQLAQSCVRLVGVRRGRAVIFLHKGRLEFLAHAILGISVLVVEVARVGERSNVCEVTVLPICDAAVGLGESEGGRRLVSVHSSQ